MNRFLSLVVSLSLASSASAQTIGRAATAAQGTGAIVVPQIGNSFTSGAMMPLNGAALTLTPGIGVMSAPSIQAFAAPAAVKQTPVAANVAVAPALKPAALNVKVSAAAKDVAAILGKAGALEKSAPSAASQAGRDVEAALTGFAPALETAAELLPAASEMGDFEKRHLARPAGQEIGESAAASSDGNVPPTPPALSPAPKDNGPFWPRLLSAGLALAPAIFLGLPLLAAQAYVIGGLVVFTSAALAVMPFLNAGSAKTLRAAPGLGLSALGLAALGISASLTFGLGVAVAPAMMWVGALALVGGWGLARYGLGKSEKRWGSYGSVETLGAFFGGLAGVVAVALAASTPLGWIGTGLLWVGSALTALLWFHLPGWVGEGLGAALTGVWHAIHGLSRVLTAIHRDTVLRDRLEKFSSKWWESSKWNGVWLALIWGPLLIVEGIMYAVSAAAGLFIGAVTAPVLALWGASQKLWPKSRLNVYFADAARFVFDNVQNGKAARYNPLVKGLVAMANSPKLAVRLPGAIGLRVAQLGWLVYSLIAAPVLSIVGLLAALRGGAYDEKRHDVDGLRVNRSDRFEKPKDDSTEPEPKPEPGASPLAPKLIATALALVPLWFFGLPILAGMSFVQIPLYFALLLPLAAMPFLGKAPMWMKSFAGRALTYNGLFLLINGNAILVGVIAMLAGWGFTRWVKKTSDKNERFDEAGVGAYFGALGSAIAIGAVWTGYVGGLVGWGSLGLAAVSSIYLIGHLPEWTFEGVKGVFKQAGKSIEAFGDVLTYWKGGTEFYDNLKSQADYWLKKTFWNGVWLSALWVPAWLALAAQYVVSIALGVVAGIVRAPFSFAASAYEEAQPRSRKAVFFSTLMKSWLAEGSKPLFEKLTAGLKKAMAAKTDVSGRPTAGAWLAGAGLQLVTLFWLIGVLALNVTGLSFVWGVIQGLRAAWSAPKVQP